MANPLTEADKRELDTQLDALKEADDLIKRAEQAGIDVAAEKSETAELRKKLTGIRRAFFPTGG